MFIFQAQKTVEQQGITQSSQHNHAGLESWIKDYPIYTNGKGISKRIGLGEILKSIEISAGSVGKDRNIREYDLMVEVNEGNAKKYGWSQNKVKIAVDKAVADYIKTNFKNAGNLKNTSWMNADIQDIDSPGKGILAFERATVGAFEESEVPGSVYAKSYIFYSGEPKKK